MLDTTDRPSIEERYGAAITTTSLRLHRTDEDTTGAVDVLIAAGMSPSALGLALLRLHTEWTAAAKLLSSLGVEMFTVENCARLVANSDKANLVKEIAAQVLKEANSGN